MDHTRLRCCQDCEGPPPCGGSKPYFSTPHSNEQECCAARTWGGHGPCIELTVRQEVEKLIDDSERELIPKFLRLGFHDCVGGTCNGCVDLNNPDNNGLREPMEEILPIVEKHKDHYSRADIWALATLVSADKALHDELPVDGHDHRRLDSGVGVHFPMLYRGREDCDGADSMGNGGPDVELPGPDLDTHEMLDFFQNDFGFTADEVVAIMGAHTVAVATRENVGFGNLGKEEGWVCDAEDYVLNNNYYSMLVGNNTSDIVGAAPIWTQELVHNNGTIPSRYQWINTDQCAAEQPIMLNSDISLVRNLTGHIANDENGIPGQVDCDFKGEETVRRMLKGGRLLETDVTCPVASDTIDKVFEYSQDEELFLKDFEKVLDKMLRNGYSTPETPLPTVRQEIEQLIIDSERELIPKFLRLGFHDCVGGTCNGCVDLNNPDNNGLREPMEEILPIVEKHKDHYSRADLWALATLVSADKALNDELPVNGTDGHLRLDSGVGVHFPMLYVGRQDCDGADAMGNGGPHVELPGPDLDTHGLLDFFAKDFGFTPDEVVAIMGVHTVAVATRENVGFGNLGKEEGWVCDAEDYVLNNNYYSMLVGDDDFSIVSAAPVWTQELVHNNGTIPSRYQWINTDQCETEQPIMLNSDMALVRNLTGHMADDENGIPGQVDCAFKEEEPVRRRLGKGKDTKGKKVKPEEVSAKLQPQVAACPVASDTIDKVFEYSQNNALFLNDFEEVLDKMLRNGYSTPE